MKPSNIAAPLITSLLAITVIFPNTAPCQAKSTTTATETSRTLPADFDAKFSRYISGEKYDQAVQLIAAQEKSTPDDPDLAVAKANLNLLMPEAQPRIVVNKYADDSKPPKPAQNSFQLLDPETSRPVGYIGEEIPKQRNAAIRQSLEILRAALQKNPNRLDIRLGISQLHQLNGDYKAILKNTEETLRYAASKNFKGMLQDKGKPYLDPASTLSDNIHHFYSEYTRETENPKDEIAFEFAETATRYFPKDVRAWNNLCGEYAQRKDYPKALECLLKAYDLDKKDPIVLMNIAHIYTISDKPKEAIIYYQKVIDLNNPEFTEDARQEIKELNKK